MDVDQAVPGGRVAQHQPHRRGLECGADPAAAATEDAVRAVAVDVGAVVPDGLTGAR